MRKIILALFIVAVMISQALFLPPVKAKSENGTLSAEGSFSTKMSLPFPIQSNVSIGMNLRYEINYTLQYNEQVNRGSENQIKISLKEGFARLDLRFADQSFTYNKSLPLGEQSKIPIPGLGIIHLAISLKAEAPVRVEGSASSSISSLTFDKEGEQSLVLKINENAKHGEIIKVILPFSLIISLVVGGFININPVQLGTAELKPSLVATITVVQSWFEQYSIFIYLIIAALVIAVSLFLIYLRRRAKQ